MAPIVSEHLLVVLLTNFPSFGDPILLVHKLGLALCKTSEPALEGQTMTEYALFWQRSPLFVTYE